MGSEAPWEEVRIAGLVVATSRHQLWPTLHLLQAAQELMPRPARLGAPEGLVLREVHHNWVLTPQSVVAGQAVGCHLQWAGRADRAAGDQQRSVVGRAGRQASNAWQAAGTCCRTAESAMPSDGNHRAAALQNGHPPCYTPGATGCRCTCTTCEVAWGVSDSG